MKPNSNADRPRLARTKRVLFSLLIVVVFFLLLEGILGIAGVEPDPDRADPLIGFARNVPHFAVAADEDGVEMVRTSPDKRKSLNDQSFPRIKAPGTTRVFFVGGSTTYGRPFFAESSFAACTHDLLADVEPSKTWEVINAGGIAYASYRVTGVMEELAAYEPDVFVIYTGQNEFLEHRTYGDLLALPGAAREVMAWALGTRTGTLIDRILHPRSDEPVSVLPADPKITAVDSVGPEAYRRDDEFEAQVARHFRLNLNRMVDIAEDVGARVLFILPASNLVDFSPFRSDPSPELTARQRAELERLLRQGTALLEAGRNPKAVEVLGRAVAIDDRHAEAHYQFGRALMATGDADRALLHFVRARDEDICPMRATSPILQCVRDVAATRGTGLIEFPAQLSGPPDETFFYDHVHLTPRATLLLGLLVTAELTGRPEDGSGMLQALDRSGGRFANPRNAEELRKLSRVLLWLKQPAPALRTAREALSFDPRNAESEVLIGSLVSGEDPAAAAEHFKRALELDPKSASAHFQVALLAERENDLTDAAAHLEAATDAAPEFTAAWEKLAMIQVRRGRVNDAVWCFRKVVALDPNRSTAHSNLGLAYAKQGEPKRAFASYAEAIRLDPKNASAHYNRGLLHEARGERDKAIGEFRRALAITPTHRGSRTRLAEMGVPVKE